MGLIEQRANIESQQKDIMAQAKSNEDGLLTAEQEQRYDQFDADYERVNRGISRLERMLERQKIEADDAAQRIEEKKEERKQTEAPSYAEAFTKHLQRNESSPQLSREYLQVLKAGEQRSGGTGNQITTTLANGGYLVPDEWTGLIVKQMQAWGGMFNAATVQNSDTGGDMPIQTLDDTAQKAVIIGQAVADTKKDLTFGEFIMKAYTYSTGVILTSWEQLQDSGFEQLLQEVFGARMGRGTNEHFTTGDGSSKPFGIVEQSVAAKASIAAIGVDDILDLYHSVDEAHRGSAKYGFMMNDSTLLAVRKLKDSDGRPIFTESYRVGEPSTLLGRPIYINRDMANATTTNKPIICGDFGKYRIRQVRGMEMVTMRERYADQRSNGYFGYARFDGRLLDVNAVKHLVIT